MYRFIRVVGTHNTVNKVFHLVALECMYTQRPFILENGLLGNVIHIYIKECTICVPKLKIIDLTIKKIRLIHPQLNFFVRHIVV